jgi:ubiquinone/menaquinone biosynthesis C-methylase UbiE
LKRRVRDFWEEASCGEVYARGEDPAGRLDAQSAARYALEPTIPLFAGFDHATGKDVLEIGVGMGSDHLRWAQGHPRSLTGVDLTERALDWTRSRLQMNGLASSLCVADAECLPFPDGSFDVVFSWGVLHHTPDTAAAFAEVHRILRPGGEARIAIYHSRSITGYMLWTRYALLTGRLRRSLADVYANHLESPGTKAFTVDEAREMVSAFKRAEVWTELSLGDLLEGEVGQRHRGRLLSVTKALWPRRLIRRFLPGHGLSLLIRAVK